MARVTVEDCVLKVPNRFELVMLAAQRARNLAAGEPLAVERDNDKNPVVALREIAEEAISLDAVREDLVRGHQKYLPADDEPEEEIVEFMAGEQGWPQIGDADAPMVAGADKVVDAGELAGDAGEAGAAAADDEPVVFDTAEEADKDESL